MHRDVTESGRGRRRPAPMPLLVGLLLALALPAATAYAQVTPPDSVTLTWTAPGDDGNVGTATAYELRSSTAPITSGNWGSATVVPGAPVPLPAGTRQRMVVRGLTFGTTYYFAIRAVDDAGNWAALSNVVRWDWIRDTAPPSAPTGVNASRQANGNVRVSWTPNAEPDLAGYHVYRALSAGGPFVRLNQALVTNSWYEDGTIPEGTARVWYQVSAMDDSGSESARSSTYALTLAIQTTTWAMETGYPNPSRAGDIVTIPLAVPDVGGSAVLEIVNVVGQRIRRLELGGLSPGSAVVRWDGRNETGREVAPGAYTAWLIVGPQRMSMRLVRVP